MSLLRNRLCLAIFWTVCITLPSSTPANAAQHGLGLRWGNAELMGYDLDPAVPVIGKDVNINWYWKALGPIPEDVAPSIMQANKSLGTPILTTTEFNQSGSWPEGKVFIFHTTMESVSYSDFSSALVFKKYPDGRREVLPVDKVEQGSEDAIGNKAFSIVIECEPVFFSRCHYGLY